MADWKDARRADPALLSEWQVYRLVDIETGPWAAFQFLVRERLREEGVTVAPDGSLRRDGRPLHLTRPAAYSAVSVASLARQEAPSCAAPHGGERLVVAVGAIGAKARLGRDATSLEVEQPPLGDLVLAQGQPQGALDDLEGGLRRGEEELAAGAPDPERAGDPAGEMEPVRHPLVDPRRRHRAAKLLERRVIRLAPRA